MPKAKSKPTPKLTKPQKLHQFLKNISVKQWLLIVVAIVLGIYVTLRIIDAVRYSTIKKDITTIGEEINQATPASEFKSEQYCEYSSMKFQKGPRGCHVISYMNYADIDISRASEIADASKKLVEKRYSLKEHHTIFQDRTVINDYLFQSNGTWCFFNSKYLPQQSIAPTRTEIFKNEINGLLISIGCSGNAMAEYFPLN